MHASSGIIALAAFLASAQAATFGFNYGAQFTDDSAKQESDFASEFAAAKKLAGTKGAFSSARLYTMIQHGTTDEIIQAIPAAIDSNTHLLLGLWASGDPAGFVNEVSVLKKAIQTYPKLASLVDGISVGSEDLYRISEIGLKAPDAAPGNGPKVISSYIQQVRNAIKGTALSDAPVGHVDTWTAWANSSNADVAKNSDFIGTDAYPYFQDTMSNSIGDAEGLLEDALAETRKYTGSTPIWITETGWPVSGPTKNLATANTKNAEEYWNKIACKYLESDDMNVWWYTLLDAQPKTPSPSFGLIDSTDSSPNYDLSCKNADLSSSSSSSSKSSHSTKSSSGSTKTGSASASATDENSPGISKSNSADAHATKTGGSYVTAVGSSGFVTGTAPAATGGSSAGNSTGTYAAPSGPAATGGSAGGAGGAATGTASAPGASDSGVATGGAASTGFSIAALVAAAAAALI